MYRNLLVPVFMGTKTTVNRSNIQSSIFVLILCIKKSVRGGGFIFFKSIYSLIPRLMIFGTIDLQNKSIDD